MPWIYWVLAFQFIGVSQVNTWDRFWQPHAEMIGNLTHPEIFKHYAKAKEQKQKLEQRAKEGKDFFEENINGTSGGGMSTGRYDPNKGLVDMEGNVIIPKEEYENLIGIDGAAISY